jgi:hypothetical protein
MAEVVKKRKGPPTDETDAQKLVRLANKRVNNAITQIRLVGNLGGYGPSAEQRNVIQKTIDAEVQKMRQGLASTTPINDSGFKLA